MSKHNNKDIIEFRLWLIDYMYGSKRKTREELKTIEPILREFNNMFGGKGYDLG